MLMTSRAMTLAVIFMAFITDLDGLKH